MSVDQPLELHISPAKPTRWRDQAASVTMRLKRTAPQRTSVWYTNSPIQPPNVLLDIVNQLLNLFGAVSVQPTCTSHHCTIVTTRCVSQLGPFECSTSTTTNADTVQELTPHENGIRRTHLKLLQLLFRLTNLAVDSPAPHTAGHGVSSHTPRAMCSLNEREGGWVGNADCVRLVVRASRRHARPWAVVIGGGMGRYLDTSLN